MPFSYNVNAVNCPSPLVPPTVTIPAAATPPQVSKALVRGVTARDSIPELWNNNAWLADYGAWGAGGCYGVVAGLDFTNAGGLSLGIAAGLAFVGGAVPVAATTHAMIDGQRNYVWVTQAGGISVTSTVVPPSAAAAFVGSVLTSGGAIIQLDGSGVVWVAGGCYRRTADTGMPTDTPPASLRTLETETAGGLYRWTGTRYWPVA